MKTAQLQIRLSESQKEELRRRARVAGQDLSEYVIERVLPRRTDRFRELLRELSGAEPAGHAWASLHDFLAKAAGAELAALPGEGIEALDDLRRCRVAAMVEQACARAEAGSPAWTGEIPPLESPQFATDLRSFRPHLLRSSPVAFRRRNLFVDATIGDRV